MRVVALGIAALTLGASGVAAACPSYPDTADTSFVENRTALALCQQRELGFTTNLAAEREDVLAGMRAEFERVIATASGDLEVMTDDEMEKLDERLRALGYMD